MLPRQSSESQVDGKANRKRYLAVLQVYSRVAFLFGVEHAVSLPGKHSRAGSCSCHRMLRMWLDHMHMLSKACRSSFGRLSSGSRLEANSRPSRFLSFLFSSFEKRTRSHKCRPCCLLASTPTKYDCQSKTAKHLRISSCEEVSVSVQYGHI